ncbi:MAG: hypothetical protein LC734_03415, partial [Acidobacteria bacterium]|nr:hypothetical protein [Acidobacteriota bacterium]
METFLEKREEKKSASLAFILGGLIGMVAIGLVIWYFAQQPSMEQQMQDILAGSYREGSPEFSEITKDIIISTGRNTVESPNAFGTISMFITGQIRNKGARTINGLEVHVAVVDQFNEVLKEKRVLVVPTQRAQLGPGEVIPITLSLEGFNKMD